jgi:hypothetical protein
MYRYLYRSSWQYCKNWAAASDLLLIGKVLAYAAAAADWIKVYVRYGCIGRSTRTSFLSAGSIGSEFVIVSLGLTCMIDRCFDSRMQLMCSLCPKDPAAIPLVVPPIDLPWRVALLRAHIRQVWMVPWCASRFLEYVLVGILARDVASPRHTGHGASILDDPPGAGQWTLPGYRGAPDSDMDPWLLKPRFHLGSPNPAGCDGSGFCGGCNDVNAMFSFRNTTHIFFQHIRSPKYVGHVPPPGYRTCWSHAASTDGGAHWQNFGCKGSGDWDLPFGVAFDGSMLGTDGETGFPVLLFDGLERNTALGVNASFVEVLAQPANPTGDARWLRRWRVNSTGNPLWNSTAIGTNPSPGFDLPDWAGGSPSLRYVVAASHANGHCALLATNRSLRAGSEGGSLTMIQVNADFLVPSHDAGRHCGQPVLSRLPVIGHEAAAAKSTSAPTHILKYEGSKGSVYQLGSLGRASAAGDPPRFVSSSAARALDIGNFQWAGLMIPQDDGSSRSGSDGAQRALVLGWVRSGQWVSGLHPPFAPGSPCNPFWPAAPPAFMTLSLLRELHFDARLGVVVTPPMREVEQLRSAAPIASLGRTVLAAGTRRPIVLAGSSGSAGVGRQLEIVAVFSAPAAGHTFGVAVLESTELNQTTDIFFTAPQPSVSDTIDATRSGFLPPSCLKQLPPSKVTGDVPLLPPTHEDKDAMEPLELRIFVDRSIVEAYAQNGRLVGTVSVRPNASATGVSVFAGGSVTLLSLRVFAIRHNVSWWWRPSFDKI